MGWRVYLSLHNSLYSLLDVIAENKKENTRGVPTSNFQYKNVYEKSQASSFGVQGKEASSVLTSQHTSQSSLVIYASCQVYQL
ncbi:hypothetical protein L1987_28031 [Smallanthus sonchifolius]|uniref:Uncharacterized protein n=1 Tax=Smallanthus sonchifolius TaxID=185202 RepID=A0ACB9IC73_9ASTR|nr:hypothetical protein L1987_28031 [Smallanthus sonchifolius]